MSPLRRQGATVPKDAFRIKILDSCLRRNDINCFPQQQLITDTVFVHVASNFSAGTNDFRVGRIADIDETDLIIFPVAAARGGLVLILKPVRTDDIRIPQSALDVAFIRIRSFLLVCSFFQARMKHTAIKRAEPEGWGSERAGIRPCTLGVH